MQDSLCGSMGPACSSKEVPASPTPCTPGLSNDLDTILQSGYGFPADSEGGASGQSPDQTSKFSSWIDMIDELIETPSEPMMSSPPRNLTVSYSPAGSVFRDRLSEKQTFISSPSISVDSMKGKNVIEDQGDLASPLSFSDRPESYHFSDQRKFLIRSSPVSQFMSITGQAQQQELVRCGISSASGSSNKPFCEQPLHTIHKAVSLPQLNQLESPPHRMYQPVPHMSLPPTRDQASSPLPILLERSRLSAFSSGYNCLSPKHSFSDSENNPFPQSPPALPNSLPSMSSFSSSVVKQRSNPFSQPVCQQSVSLQRNIHINLPTIEQRAQAFMDFPQQHSGSALGKSQSDDPQDSGLRLVHLLLACAEAVSRENPVVAEELMLQLKQLVSATGNSMQRVAAYFTDAIHSRLTRTGNKSYISLRTALCEEILAACQILYQACPYIKFAHFTSNQAIFEALDGEERVHIVDLDILQGYQWPAFIQALAARPGGAAHLRITGVGRPLEAVQETGKRLAELAESLHVPFQFHSVGERLENLKVPMLQRRIGEALAVNSVTRLHRLLSETMTPLIGILHMIREQAPTIFTLVEQEASHNGPFFLGRFLEALHYYSAIFDSLDATLPQNSPERTRVEQLIFAPEITNIVACEGSERIERHEKLERWRKIMDGSGFQSVPLSANAVNQSKLLLGLYPCDGYTLKEDRGCLVLGWQDRPIIAASAWRC